MATPVLGLLSMTWRVEVRGRDRWQVLVDQRAPFIFLLWHEVLLPLLWYHRGQGVAIVVSDSQDGRYLNALAARLGYRAIIGSSSKGGVRALLAAVRTLTEGTPVAFTPDGPRGPRREMKPGILAAAQRSGAVILPIHAEIDRARRLDSWDRFAIPKLGARIRIGYGEAFAVEPGEEGLTRGSTLAVQRLEQLGQEMAWHPAVATDIG